MEVLAQLYAGAGPGPVAAAAAAGARPAQLADPAPDTPGGVLSLSPAAVALAAALIVVQALVSLRFRLKLHTQLLIAAVRCIVQLSVLGYILGERRGRGPRPCAAGAGGPPVTTHCGRVAGPRPKPDGARHS
jgi:hypothetical protein